MYQPPSPPCTWREMTRRCFLDPTCVCTSLGPVRICRHPCQGQICPQCLQSGAVISLLPCDCTVSLVRGRTHDVVQMCMKAVSMLQTYCWASRLPHMLTADAGARRSARHQGASRRGKWTGARCWRNRSSPASSALQLTTTLADPTTSALLSGARRLFTSVCATPCVLEQLKWKSYLGARSKPVPVSEGSRVRLHVCRPGTFSRACAPAEQHRALSATCTSTL